MAHPSAMPNFGNWENEENVNYTAYFEKARKVRNGGKIIRSDSQENPSTFNTKPPIHASSFQMEPVEAKKGREAMRSKHKHHLNQEEIDIRRSTDSSLQHEEAGARESTNVLRTKHKHMGDGRQRRPTDSSMYPDTGGRMVTANSLLQHYGGASSGDAHKRAMQRNVASDLGIYQSPLHPHNQPKIGGRGNGVSSLSWERKSSSEGTHGLAPMTPGRSRLRSATRGDDTPDHGAAVPKFGAWDETNPASADGYTYIFNRIREERQDGAAKVPVLPTEPSHSNEQKQYGNKKSKSRCCFSWGRR